MHFGRYRDDQHARWPRWAEIVGVSFAWNDHEGWYLPFRAPAGQNRLDVQTTLEALRPVLENPAIEKIGQNLKFDVIVFRTAGIALAGTAFDTMVASYLLDAGQRNHNLNELAKRYLHHATIKIEELIGSGKNQKRMDEVPLEQVTDYAAEDALLPVQLRPVLAEKLREAQLDDLFAKVEMPLVDVLAEMEYQRHQDRRRAAQRTKRSLRAAHGRRSNRRFTNWPAIASISPRPSNCNTCFSSRRNCRSSSARRPAKHRRECAGSLGAAAPAAGQDRRISPICQAQGDLCRCIARDGPSA